MGSYQTAAAVKRAASRIEELTQRHERWMYRGSSPNRMAAFMNRLWALAGRLGIWRSHLVRLEVTGRSTGRTLVLPLIAADVNGSRYLVAMLGERAGWVANVRAAGGRAVIRAGRAIPVLLEEVDPAERPAIVRRHLAVAPAARSFFPVSLTAAAGEFDPPARALPVFRIREDLQAQDRPLPPAATGPGL
jgi:hypothetical protein